ncbi:MAG: hypothetical protein J5873_04220 [Bacteroidales bacterium]|nr:hypothetical protein [Bacteroidales bacterium]
MENLSKKTRTIAFLLLGTLIVGYLPHIDVICFNTMLPHKNWLVGNNWLDRDIWLVGNNWLIGVMGLTQLFLIGWFFWTISKNFEKEKRLRTAAILAYVGIGLVLINNIAYAIGCLADVYTAVFSETFYMTRLFACLYPGLLLLSIATIMVARYFSRSSLAYFGGLSFVIYTIFRILLHPIFLLYFNGFGYCFDPNGFGYIILHHLSILADIGFLLLLFGISKGSALRKHSKEDELSLEGDAPLADMPTKPNGKKPFFFKRWLVRLSDLLDNKLFHITPDSGKTIGNFFWMLFVIGFILGGINITVSLLQNGGDYGLNIVKKISIIAGMPLLAPFIWKVINCSCHFEEAKFRILRALFVFVWCLIGIALGFLLGQLIVAAVITIIALWLLLKVLGAMVFEDTGNGNKRKKEPEAPSVDDDRYNDGDVVSHDGARWKYNKNNDGPDWGEKWTKLDE